MSKGILYFSFNNESINYIRITELSARKAKYFLNVPVSIVTDKVSAESITNVDLFDHIILVDSESYYFQKNFANGEIKEKLQWKNSHRNSAYELTPYDETLVLDSDYIVNSNVLNYCWNQPHNFLIYKDSYNLSGKFDISPYMSEHGIPFYWATVFYFKKVKETKIFFDLVSYIKLNWNFYRKIYKIESTTFRNDFAFTIAIHIMNGFSENIFAKNLPGKLFYITDRDYCLDINNDSIKFLVRGEKNNYIPIKISNNDVHIMNKYSLMKVLENE